MFGLLSTYKALQYALALSLVTSLIACMPTEKASSTVEANKEQAQDSKDNKESQEIPDVVVRDSAMKANKVAKPIVGKKTISFNGEKFEYNGGLVTKGTKLFNFLMAEHGMVKGSFVVVTKANTKLNTLPVELKAKAKLAKDTYRIIPLKGGNLQATYKQLKANKQLLQVELEIDYSPKPTVAEF
ncbi:hypothetical protein [Litorilituus sediminis]|uniref:Uncharacterized protein n=1 Tax=Litorilituus sediminis TaxID=718192 RepID=A0A4P6P1X3_9GAMM|nr:hypothetical protein [Litorilituus sediminis]QBG35356.1 hypothetical protein EMK97_06300 [Litorilituus sediminis]